MITRDQERRLWAAAMVVAAGIGCAAMVAALAAKYSGALNPQKVSK